MPKTSRPTKSAKNKSTVRNSRTTVSGPAEPDASGAGDRIAEKAAGTRDVASGFPFNPDKAAEYNPAAALALGTGEQLLRDCGVDAAWPDGQPDPGIIIASDASAGTPDFVAAIATHRHFDRETDPPPV
jgi:catalase